MRAEWERIGRGEEISASSGMPLCNPTRRGGERREKRERERKREKEREREKRREEGSLDVRC